MSEFEVGQKVKVTYWKGWTWEGVITAHRTDPEIGRFYIISPDDEDMLSQTLLESEMYRFVEVAG